MDTYTSTEAKREFGEVIMKAQSAPVCINRNGKAVAVIISASEYEALLKLRESHLTRAIQEGIEDYQLRKVSSASEVFERLRKKAVE